MTAYDPAIIERLVAEARTDDAKMSAAPWEIDCEGDSVIAPSHLGRMVVDLVGAPNCGGDGPAIARTRNNLAAMADQLEAARREVERLTGHLGSRSEHSRLLAKSQMVDRTSIADLTAERDALRAEVERLGRLQRTTVRIATEEAGVRDERFANLQQANRTLATERDAVRTEAAVSQRKLGRVTELIDSYQTTLLNMDPEQQDEAHAAAFACLTMIRLTIYPPAKDSAASRKPMFVAFDLEEDEMKR